MQVAKWTNVTFLLGALLAACPGQSAPPPGVDPDSPIHIWFERQHSVTGSWCCNVADGHILSEADWRISGGNYEVRIDQIWRRVPATSLRDPNGGPNPTGHAVVWWSRVGDDLVIHCFAPGHEL